MKKYIVILSNEPEFSKKYGSNSKCIKFIEKAEKFIRIRFCNHNNFGNRKDIIALHTIKSLVNYNGENYFNELNKFNEILISAPILFSNNDKEKYKIYNKYQKNKFNIKFIDFPKNIYDKFQEYNNFEIINEEIKWKNKLFSGNLILLYYFINYKEYDIYLLGFNNSNLFFNKHNENIINNTNHNIDHNIDFLNFMLNNYKNIKIINSF